VSSELRIQVGGTLVPGRSVYIERPEDAQLVEILSGGDYASVFASRQVGKSSLMVRTALKLREDGWNCAIVDLTALGRPPDIESYLISLTAVLASQLNIKFDPRAFWTTFLPGYTAVQKFTEFCDVVLRQLNGNVAIFLDEVDSSLRLDYTDQLFLAFRTMYNERGINLNYNRIVVCLVGATTVGELIRDRLTTSYNIGQILDLNDFDLMRDDISILIRALETIITQDVERIVERVFYWTDGHPFLTMAVSSEALRRVLRRPEEIDSLVHERYFGGRSGREDTHFRTVEKLINSRVRYVIPSLGLYARVLSGERISDGNTEEYKLLNLLGLVKSNPQGVLRARNKIYERVFDERWLRSLVRKLEREAPYYHARQRTKNTLTLLAVAVSIVIYVLGWIFLHPKSDLSPRLIQIIAVTGLTFTMFVTAFVSWSWYRYFIWSRPYLRVSSILRRSRKMFRG
jgi:hypothetical protein